MKLVAGFLFGNQLLIIIILLNSFYLAAFWSLIVVKVGGFTFQGAKM